MVRSSKLYTIGKQSHASPHDYEASYGDASNVQPGQPVLLTYDFKMNVWVTWALPDSPACGLGSLLAIHEVNLILYGKFARFDFSQHQASA